MQKRAAVLTLVTLLSLALTLPAFAGGVKDGTGPIHSQTAFSYSGVVISCLAGDGIVLATTNNVNVTIYGMGPATYWDSLGVPKPAVGDEIAVKGYTVNYNGELRNIAYSVTLPDGTTVTLRDAQGRPAWR